MKFTLAGIFILFIFKLSAQSNFLNKTIDFGSIEKWNNPTATFTLVNSGNKTIHILPTRKAQDLQITYTQKPLLPGESINFYVKYYTKDIGYFTRKFNVYTSDQTKPHELTLVGNIITLSPNAFKTCPPVGQGQKTDMRLFPAQHTEMDNLDNTIIVQGKVLDKLTRKRIPYAQVDFYKNNEKKYTIKNSQEGDFQGRIDPGDYIIKVFASNYYPKEKKITLQNQLTTVNIRLEPIQETVLPQLNTQTQHERIHPDLSTKTEEATDLPTHLYNSNNITFLIDESTSMGEEGKLKALQKAIKRMIEGLRDIDYITIITYKQKAYLKIEHVPGSQKEKFYTIIDNLSPSGLTSGIAGLTEAYELAKKYYIPDGNNQIILATDGLFSQLGNEETEVNKMAKKEASVLLTGNKPVKLTVVGFGNDAKAKNTMGNLAKNGKGNYVPISLSNFKKEVILNEIKYQSKKN